MLGWTLLREQGRDKADSWTTALVGVSLFSVILLFLGFVQYGTPGLAGTDGYYHIKMGWLIRQQGLTPLFTWLPQTILNPAAYYNHHLLYHVYLALFSFKDPAVDGGTALITGAKLASMIMPALAFMSIWWLLKRQAVPLAAFWTLGLLAVSEAFLYRMSMPRAQSASLLVLVWGLHRLLTGRYRLLLPLGFAYVWLYNAFPLLLLLIGVFIIAELFVNRRFLWQPLAWAGAGIALGVIINPYFPENVSFIISHLLPKLGESAVRVGNEWQPYQTWTLVENSGPALALFMVAIFARVQSQKRWDVPTLAAFGLTVIFGFMLFKSRRFVEYFPAFVLLFAALSAAPLLRDWQARFSRRPLLVPALFILLLIPPLYLTLTKARESLASSQPIDKYQLAARWLDDNSPDDVVVFQTDWDDFTRLFFHNTNAVYTVGLDPTYLQLYDQQLYDTWVDITQGRVENPAGVIRDRFGGEFVFSDLKHERFMERAEKDPALVEVYRDNFAVIYQVDVPQP